MVQNSENKTTDYVGEGLSAPPLTPSARDARSADPADGESSRPAAPPAPEQPLWVGRTNWKHYAGRLSLWLIAILVVAFFIVRAATRSDSFSGRTAGWIILLVVTASAAVVLGPAFWTILSHRYRLTTQRLIIERGILSQTIDQTELIRVDDVRIYKTFFDRILGLGSVAVISTDATDRELLIPGVPRPDALADSIRARMRAARQKSLYVENL